jgi:hypothetical protein
MRILVSTLLSLFISFSLLGSDTAHAKAPRGYKINAIQKWAVKRGAISQAKFATRYQFPWTFVKVRRAKGFKVVKLMRVGHLLNGFVEHKAKRGGERGRDEFLVNLDSLKRHSTARLFWRALFQPQRLPVNYVGVRSASKKGLDLYALPSGSVKQENGVTIRTLPSYLVH